MTPERLGPFLLSGRLPGRDAEAYRARRVVTTGHVSAPVRLEVRRPRSEAQLDALVETAAWGARVAHPGVLRVVEVGVLDDALYAVSELCCGRDLATLLDGASPGEAAPSVPVALSIAAQLARLAREIHDDRGGQERLGSFRPEQVWIGYDGRVRVRAAGTFAAPRSGEPRDPFLAPELARGAAPGPAADVWTVARVLRAVLATDPQGRKTPKVSTLYKDSLGPLLEGALARDPTARMSAGALERRLLELLGESADDETTPLVELLEEHEGGRIPPDDEPLALADLERLAVEAGPRADLRYPRAPGATDHARPAVTETQVGPPPDVVDGGDDSSLFGRVMAEAEREMAAVSDDGEPLPTTSFARPRVSLAADDELSLDDALDDGADVRLGSAQEVEVGLDQDLEADLDAIARSSLEGAPFASDDPLAAAGTAVIERPPPLPPSQHDEGDVFQAPAPTTTVSRLSSRERSSLERSRASARASVAERAPSQPPPPPPSESFHEEGEDVFTATLRPAELLPELVGGATKVGRSRAKGAPGASATGAPPAGAGPDPDKTAFLDNPAAAFKSSTGPRAQPTAPPSAPAIDADDEPPTERISEDLVREAVRLARASKPAPPSSTNAGPSGFGNPLVSDVGGMPSSPQQTALLPVHDVRAVLAARGGLDAEIPEGADPPTLDEILPEDPELGLLVIDVPEAAVVFVNGDERGRGRTVLEGLDRFASFVVRVHHRGHLPWTGTVTLKGMRAARIEPELQRR